MAKNVWDLALLMDVMQGADPEDVASKLSNTPPKNKQIVLTQTP
jgi:Asp-tRNA(Asn)/Glu-tRNA(Gln) amidotransferase A subunit family amidase